MVEEVASGKEEEASGKEEWEDDMVVDIESVGGEEEEDQEEEKLKEVEQRHSLKQGRRRSEAEDGGCRWWDSGELGTTAKV